MPIWIKVGAGCMDMQIVPDSQIPKITDKLRERTGIGHHMEEIGREEPSVSQPGFVSYRINIPFNGHSAGKRGKIYP